MEKCICKKKNENADNKKIKTKLKMNKEKKNGRKQWDDTNNTDVTNDNNDKDNKKDKPVSSAIT
jgi:hypothetical protein